MRIIFLILTSFLSFGNTVPSQNLSTEKIDEIWEKTANMSNMLKENVITLSSGGKILLFKNEQYGIELGVINWPGDLTANYSCRLLIGGKPILIPQFDAYQIISIPKVIKKQAVFRISIGEKYSKHCYIVVRNELEPDWYITETN
jgi:hypothetical protein